MKTDENLFNLSKSTITETTQSTAALNEMNQKLDKLLDIIQKQNSQLVELKSEVADLKISHSSVSKATPTTAAQPMDTSKMEARMCRLVEEYLVRYDREYGRKLEAFQRGR